MKCFRSTEEMQATMGAHGVSLVYTYIYIYTRIRVNGECEKWGLCKSCLYIHVYVGVNGEYEKWGTW